MPLRELVTVKHTIIDKSIYHKNLMPVTYVIGDVAGVVESPVYAILKMNKALAKLDTQTIRRRRLAVENFATTDMPFTDHQPLLKWDGEWHITIEVFRDLGMAFAAVLVLIYILMVGWFKSFLTPLIVMVVIPFSLIGVLPAHGILHAFFTATSMIGFMAGAGIVVRNSIILVDFIEMRLAEGHPLAEAVVEAGMVRFRPIMLTALAVVAGASVILSDPIFQGLAISLMAGSLISMFSAPVLCHCFISWLTDGRRKLDKPQLGVRTYPRFHTRIQRLEAHADRIGWGYGDYLRAQVGFLENELGAESQ